MKSTPVLPLGTTLPALKVPVSTLVDSTRRLFRHSVWYAPAEAGHLRLTFWPGWLGNLPSGRVCHVREGLCREGELHDAIERVQAEYGVHLWLRPIKVPTTWPRGNWWWPEVFCQVWDLDAPKAHVALKAVAA